MLRESKRRDRVADCGVECAEIAAARATAWVQVLVKNHLTDRPDSCTALREERS